MTNQALTALLEAVASHGHINTKAILTKAAPPEPSRRTLNRYRDFLAILAEKGMVEQTPAEGHYTWALTRGGEMEMQRLRAIEE